MVLVCSVLRSRIVGQIRHFSAILHLYDRSCVFRIGQTLYDSFSNQFRVSEIVVHIGILALDLLTSFNERLNAIPLNGLLVDNDRNLADEVCFNIYFPAYARSPAPVNLFTCVNVKMFLYCLVVVGRFVIPPKDYQFSELVFLVV